MLPQLVNYVASRSNVTTRFRLWRDQICRSLKFHAFRKQKSDDSKRHNPSSPYIVPFPKEENPGVVSSRKHVQLRQKDSYGIPLTTFAATYFTSERKRSRQLYPLQIDFSLSLFFLASFPFSYYFY